MKPEDDNPARPAISEHLQFIARTFINAVNAGQPIGEDATYTKYIDPEFTVKVCAPWDLGTLTWQEYWKLFPTGTALAQDYQMLVHSMDVQIHDERHADVFVSLEAAGDALSSRRQGMALFRFRNSKKDIEYHEYLDGWRLLRCEGLDGIVH